MARDDRSVDGPAELACLPIHTVYHIVHSASKLSLRHSIPILWASCLLGRSERNAMVVFLSVYFLLHCSCFLIMLYIIVIPLEIKLHSLYDTMAKNWTSLLIVLAVTASSWVAMLATRPARKLRGAEELRSTETRQVRKPAAIVAAIINSQCTENLSSNWTITSLQATDNYSQYKELSDFLEGPAMNETEWKDAVCEFRQVMFWSHFPHT
jgi:hypothetical protein